jgi:FkbM family methyltransferase
MKCCFKNFIYKSILLIGNAILFGGILSVGVLCSASNISKFGIIIVSMFLFLIVSACSCLYEGIIGKILFYFYSCVFIVFFIFSILVGVTKRVDACRFSFAMTLASVKHLLTLPDPVAKSFPSHCDLLNTHIKLAAKNIISAKDISSEKNDKIFSYTVNFYNYKNMLHLFDEIFIEKIYYFYSSKPNPVIVDCGSHIGASVLFFKSLYPAARITAIEPDDKAFSLLTKNVKNNRLSDITLVNKAVYDKESTLTFYTEKTDIACTIGTVMISSEKKIKKEVACTKLSNYLTQLVDFLKMDIEGAETVVIEELERSGTLKNVKEMVLEYHHHMTPNDDQFSKILGILERNNFGYQVRAGGKMTDYSKGSQQFLIVHAYQKI